MRDNGNHEKASTPPASPRPNRRQQQILELAAIGLSDDEIAARLHVSRRTIRFQVEKIFRMFGVRSHSEAIAMWMDSKSQAQRPVHECPYRKPFPDHFAECPAYEARQVVTLDEWSRPAGRMWTCRHLESRLIAKTENRWYGACVLGDTVDRRRWAEQIGADRIHTLNQLLHELAPATGPFAQRLWELQDERARALEREQDPRPATQSMEALAGRFIDYIETFLSWHRGMLEQNQLAIDDCVKLARRLIDRVLEQESPAAWDDRFDALMRFPIDVWSAVRLDTPKTAIQARR